MSSVPVSTSTAVPHPLTAQGLIFDHSSWGRLVVTGEGGLDYLHNQSTNDLNGLQAGEGCETVFVTATAQILDWVTVHRTETELWMITSPTRRQLLQDTLRRTLMFVRGTQLNDCSESTILWRLVGDQSPAILSQLGLSLPPSLSEYHHLVGEVQGIPVRVIGGNGLGLPGYTLIADRERAETLRTVLCQTDLVWCDETTWDRLCVLQGRPEADRELTESYNPLEAGLWSAISLSKGCYIGQEVLAKQVTYGRIRQTLWGIQLSGTAEPGTEIQIGGNKVGLLTRVVSTEQGAMGLAYIRSKAAPHSGQSVHLGAITGELVERPLLNYPPQS